MNRLLKRMRWHDISYDVRFWMVWFLLLVGIGTVLEFVIPGTYDVDWMQWVALALLCLLVSRLIIGGPSKKKSNEEEE